MNKKKHRFACIILNYNDSETTMSLANCIKEYSAIGGAFWGRKGYVAEEICPVVGKRLACL